MANVIVYYEACAVRNRTGIPVNDTRRFNTLDEARQQIKDWRQKSAPNEQITYGINKSHGAKLHDVTLHEPRGMVETPRLLYRISMWFRIGRSAISTVFEVYRGFLYNFSIVYINDYFLLFLIGLIIAV